MKKCLSFNLTLKGTFGWFYKIVRFSGNLRPDKVTDSIFCKLEHFLDILAVTCQAVVDGITDCSFNESLCCNCVDLARKILFVPPENVPGRRGTRWNSHRRRFPSSWRRQTQSHVRKQAVNKYTRSLRGARMGRRKPAMLLSKWCVRSRWWSVGSEVTLLHFRGGNRNRNDSWVPIEGRGVCQHVPIKGQGTVCALYALGGKIAQHWRQKRDNHD